MTQIFKAATFQPLQQDFDGLFFFSEENTSLSGLEELYLRPALIEHTDQWLKTTNALGQR